MVQSLEGIAPFQIAFVVSDLERATREFDALFAAGPWRGWTFGPQGQGREYRGQPAEWTLRLALNNRSPQYELIEPDGRLRLGEKVGQKVMRGGAEPLDMRRLEPRDQVSLRTPTTAGDHDRRVGAPVGAPDGAPRTACIAGHLG
jgi:hypothetical protein